MLEVVRGRRTTLVEAITGSDGVAHMHAVVKRAGTTVFINVPKLVVGYMPWNEPPTAQAQQAKRGPSRADVQQLYGSRSPTGDSGS